MGRTANLCSAREWTRNQEDTMPEPRVSGSVQWTRRSNVKFYLAFIHRNYRAPAMNARAPIVPLDCRLSFSDVGVASVTGSRWTQGEGEPTLDRRPAPSHPARIIRLERPRTTSCAGLFVLKSTEDLGGDIYRRTHSGGGSTQRRAPAAAQILAEAFDEIGGVEHALGLPRRQMATSQALCLKGIQILVGVTCGHRVEPGRTVPHSSATKLPRDFASLALERVAEAGKRYDQHSVRQQWRVKHGLSPNQDSPRCFFPSAAWE